MKTPVSILHDYLKKIDLNPVYELHSEYITRRTVLFHYRVTVGDVQATATGFSKKQAKQNVSEKFLDLLYKYPEIFRSVFHNQVECFDDILKLRPVQSLYDICMANYWYLPTYEYVAQEGPANDRTFTCVARIHDIHREGIGVGRSKKVSKANAACSLVKKLTELYGSSAEQLISHPNTNYLMTLHHLVFSKGLKLNFHFSKTSNRAQKQCLLQILASPVIICSGFGITQEDAVNDASMNAINCLKIVNHYHGLWDCMENCIDAHNCMYKQKLPANKFYHNES